VTVEPVARPARIVFFGSGAFALPILDALASLPEVLLVGVVSVPDRRAGRGGRMTSPPVADRARHHGQAPIQPARLRDPGFATGLRDLAPDAAVLADYGRLVPPEILASRLETFLDGAARTRSASV
jgi:methionyl-tRNA formyltransferase